MRLPAILAALVAVACAAPQAYASTGSFEVGRLPGSTLPAETIPSITGPVPAGDAVAFAVSGMTGEARVRLGAPGAAARDVATFAAREGASLALQASATRLAAVRHAYVCSDCRYMNYRTTLDALLAGPVGGPLATIASCEEGQPCALEPAFFCRSDRSRFMVALSGDLLAVVDSCPQTASVRNLATGATLDLGPAQAVAVAGPYVATIRAATSTALLVVRDAASGTELYRSPVSETAGFPVSTLALVADGTAAYGVATRSGVAVVVTSVANPGGRVVRTMSHGSAVVGAGPAGVLVRSGAARLELLALDGAAPRSLDIPDLVGAPAFDGRTIAWAQRPCVTTAITSWTLGDPAPAAPDLRCPTPRPSRAALTLPRDRRLRAAVTCPATARGGCLATVRMTAIRRGRLPRGRNAAERLYRLGLARVALDPGERRRVEIGVPRGAARWVRRHAPLRLRIVATSEGRAGTRPASDSGTAARTVALRAAR